MVRRSLAALWCLAALAACDTSAPPPDAVTRGAQTFAQNCAACHGATGTGDGPASDALTQTPPDLTTLSARNGGTFPATRVMSTVWGEAGDSHRATMPEFDTMFEDAPMVPYDGGDGIATPTPLPLVDLAEYLKTIQN